jgi:ribose-phosphate pyrophosphokinase
MAWIWMPKVVSGRSCLRSNACNACAQDVRSVAVACTHGLFAGGALDKLAACDVTEIVCTNSAPVPADHPKLHVLSVAPALAEAINRIHDGESVSALFDN